MARTRFAPSPTGSLHIGGVRTALYSLLQARASEGKFLLRIEDTDQVRSTEEASLGIVRDLHWLGLEWDEGPEVGGPTGPYHQSQRLSLYDEYLAKLLDSGHAYLAWETKEELDAERQTAIAAKATFVYRRRPYTPEQLARFEAEGRVPVVRVRAPAHDVVVHDEVLGDVTVEAAQLDDIVVRKADGFPTYHYAVVIDDHLMAVDLILRGQEHLMNTHKHAGIYEAFGWTPPRCGHLPLINNPAGAKMSKRDKAKVAREAARKAAPEALSATGFAPEELSAFIAKKNDGVAIAEAIAHALGVELPLIEVNDFRKAGYLPEALLNYLLLLGWNPGNDREMYTLAEMIEAFSLDRINKTAARFDPVKLRWMNHEYLKKLPLERLLFLHDQYLAAIPESPMAGLPADRRAQVFAMYRERAATFAEMDEMGAFLFRAPRRYDEKAVKKHLDGGGWERLAQARESLGAVRDWSSSALEAAILPHTDGTGPGMGQYAQPLRVAITGTAVSPPIYDVLAWLGREESLARIDRLLATR
jgi:glutamyl-tRNA synthetase